MFKFKLWRKKYFHYFLFFSLLLHLIFYLVFFNVSFRQHSVAMIRGLLDSIALPPAERQKRMQKHQDLIKKLQELKQEKDSGLPAKLKPRKSDFGWVFFNDEPSAAAAGPVQVPTTEEGEVAQAPTRHATELIPEKPKIPAELPAPEPSATPPATAPEKHVEQKIAQEATPPIIKQPARKTPVTERQQKAVAAQPPAPTKKIAQPEKREVKQHIKPRTEKQLKKELKKTRAADELTIDSLIDEIKTEADVYEPEEPRPLEERFDAPMYDDTSTSQSSIFAQGASADIQARIARIARIQEQVGHFAPAPAETMGGKPSTGKVATAKVRGARAMNKKSSRGIIALTKGFVENLKDEGDDLIERDGDPNKRPSFEEMKYISYESNINWCLQAAWKQNFAYNPTVQAREGKAVIEFTLDEKGYVTHSELLQSSGYRELDAVIMKNLQFANPFPPLPKHFGVKNYTTGRIIHVFCNKFGM